MELYADDFVLHRKSVDKVWRMEKWSERNGSERECWESKTYAVIIWEEKKCFKGA